MSWMPLARRHDAVELLPRIELCPLNDAQNLRAGSLVMLGWYLGDRIEPVQVRVVRYALASYTGRTIRGGALQFHAMNVLRIVWTPP